MRVVQAPRASAILYSLLVSRGDIRPWLLPANICPIVPITFLRAQIPFELVDISATTLHMDLEQAEALIAKRRYGGVLYAHTYGESSTPEEFFRHIKQLDGSIVVVDDRCLCIPDLSANVDSNAHIQLYSTGYAKIVDLGLGGYAFLDDEISYSHVHLLFDQHAHDKIEDDYKKSIRDHTLFEYKDCDWLQTDADLLPWQEYCQRIEVELERTKNWRAKLNSIYASHLPRVIQLPESYQTWRFNICVKNKDHILRAIFDAGLFASSHYASLAGILAEGNCPEANWLHGSVINLFNDYHFDEKKAGKICEIILKHLPESF